MKKIAAFFDIDGTIYREGLITEVFKKIIKYELLDEKKWYREVKPAFINWDKRQGDYDTYLLKMVDIYIEAIKGINKYHIDYIAKKVIEQKGDRVYTFTRERIKWHKEQGHIVIAISGSPIELVSEMANKYNMDDYRGTIYKSDENNMYNGDIIPMWDSESKEKAILEMTCKYNIDLDKSFAYGDTSGDFTMFKSVGIPYAINPTKELLDKVLNDEDIKEKIKVIVERKDVTYSLDINSLNIV
ncbi:HAD-IB family hydrolase [Clostridium gasigenes]|uniref:phosphoserine phosphatase n=1 Tax=Clostridium gasigenes TaxID=94869 RepID=A0A1H0NAV4_9CLOT|nr:HAD-IB family hydrolase [Clostridium gasigenes]MBB6623883.1 HAD-IB family hydrolase [Clostridium gasigenes]MBB6715996.1 HAD-IB family hydrolase [Clostridium gasigenes]MBU3087429.1 HAD-IB family hydrolase [Clostridium gasigenes]MBU3106678.1 HAD-IB family hydrolase [Clostridium gasigenes]MBU3131644.1 HAD-IB family hydrolase [Clostridium gasigenes]